MAQTETNHPVPKRDNAIFDKSDKLSESVRYHKRNNDLASNIYFENDHDQDLEGLHNSIIEGSYMQPYEINE